jgi:fatty-acyl-CoA synthase
MEAHERSPRDVSSVRTGILATGMSSSVPIAKKARKVLGRFLSGYGMSEFGVGAALSALDSTEEQCTEASGFPAPGYEIRVVDPVTSTDQPPGVPGEILVRSYMTMQGYYGKPLKPRRRSTATAGCTRATWASCARTDTSASWAAGTCSRSAARTSTPWKSRPS